MVYDVNLTLTGGEPYGTTKLVAMHVYDKAFTARNYGVGQAEALILFVIVALISGVQIYIGKKEGGRGIMARGASQAGGTKKKVVGIVGFIVIAALFVLYMVPFFVVILNSFKQKRDIITNPLSFIAEKGYTLENYVRAFEKMDFLKAFGNSLFVTCLSTLLVVIIASMTAYYFSRANNWFSKIFLHS